MSDLTPQQIKDSYEIGVRQLALTLAKGFEERFGYSVSLNQFLADVTKANLWHVLLLVAKADRYLKKRKSFHDPQTGLRVDGLAFIAKSALLLSPETAGLTPGAETIAHWCQQFTDFESKAVSDIVHLFAPGGNTELGIEALIKKGSLTSAFTWESREISRYVLLYEEMERLAGSADLDRRIRAALGTSYMAYAAAGQVCVVLADGGALFDLSLVDRLPNPDARPAVDQFIHSAAASVSEFRQAFAGTETSIFGFNPLQKFPLVKASDGRILAPMWNQLQRKFSVYTYHTLFALETTEFSRLFGEAFEAYVGKVLKSLEPSAKIYEEQQWGPAGSRKASCDWIASEGRDLLALECKNKRLTLSTKESGDVDCLKADLKAGISHGIDQAHATIVAIIGGIPELKDVSHARRFIPAVVTPERLPTINNAAVKNLIRTCLKSPIPDSAEEHIVIGIEELEQTVVVCRKTNQRLALLLRKWRESESYGQGSLGHFLSDHFSEDERENDLFAEDHLRIRDSVVRRFFSV